MNKIILVFFLVFAISLRLNAQDNIQRDSSEAQYLAKQKILGKKFSDRFYPNYVSLHRLSEKDFVAMVDSAAAGFIILLDSYKTTLPSLYIAAQRFEIKLYFDKILIEYPNNHEIYSSERHARYALIEEKVAANLTLFNDPALIGNTDLMPFIDSFLGNKVNQELTKTVYNGLYNKRLYALWNLLPRYFTNQQCKSYQQYHLLFEHITRNGIKYTDKLCEEFKAHCRDTALTRKLVQEYRHAQRDLKDHLVREYKRIGNYGLNIHIFQNDKSGTANKPAIVFFHGGSWSEGQPSWHFDACRNYAAQGWIACAVEYRIYGSQATLPFAAVRDARSAIRWLREHGAELHIDTARIVATGNSAGGHLVLAAALADKWNEKTDHLQFSPIPNVLLVNSGVYDLTDEKTAWIRKDLRNKDLVKEISPNWLVKKHLPPMLLIHSAADQNVPYATAHTFAARMQAAGNPVEFKTIQDGGHFIFDHPRYTPTVFAWRKEFLNNLGYPRNDGL